MHLIPGKPFVIDHSNAQRTQLMDIKTLDWSDELLNLFQISKQQLPACKPVKFNYGRLLDTDIEIKAVCGDQNAVFSGSANHRSDTAVVNLGSGAFIMCPQSKLKSNRQLLTTIIKSDDKSA
ncbi:MAG TPA: glycerol kinase, partial [Gammaproteobacteria bacterium]|nr:glycerol kinase [Gammaproteobacteria bacterium]